MSDDDSYLAIKAAEKRASQGEGPHPDPSSFLGAESMIESKVSIPGVEGAQVHLGILQGGSLDDNFKDFTKGNLHRNFIKDVATGTLVGKSDEQMNAFSEVSGGLKHELGNVKFENSHDLKPAAPVLQGAAAILGDDGRS